MAQAANPTTMDELVQDETIDLVPFKAGQVVETRVVSANKNKVMVDLNGLTLGIIPGRELSPDASELKAGDSVLASIITLENEEGYAVLSMRRADRERIWRSIKDKQESGEVVNIKVTDANKGGLLVDFSGLEGFIPTSQLTAAHYPKVGENERDQIVTQLRQLIGETLGVKILSFDQQGNKLIFSEKAAGDTQLAEKAKTLPVNERLTGEVTGVVDFGVFVKVSDVEGLVHISEVSWEKVDNLKDRFKPGDKVEVLVIGVEGSRVSLSMKRLQDDPWKKKIDGLTVGQSLEGEVTRVTPFGAFVRLREGVDGLVHISELGEKLTDPHSVVTVGQKYPFEILSIDPEAHRISLRLKNS